MEKLRIGVIGLGWPGQRHLEGYTKRDDVEVVALSDVNTAAAENAKEQFGVSSAEVWGNYEEMLAKASVDAVSVCTPNFLHAPIAVAALGAGKHVLLEKPLAHTLDEGERIARAVADSGKTLMMAFNNRHRLDSRLLKARIEQGELGEIYYAKSGWLRRDWNPSVRGWFTKKELSGGGPLIDLGVHMLDLALWFMGNPRPVSVSGSVYRELAGNLGPEMGEVDIEDLAAAFVKLEGGRTVVVDASWVSFIEHPDYVYTQLFGTKGGAKIERAPQREELSIYGREDGIYTVESPRFDAYSQARNPSFHTHESFAHEVGEFVDAVKEGRTPDSPVEHGLDILRVLDAIYRSAESGREIQLDGEAATPGAGAGVGTAG